MTDDIKIEVENKNTEDTTWRSMCITADKNAIQYFTQITIITGIMSFSIYKLTTNETCEAQQAYMGLLTMLIGLVLPSPVFNKK